MGMESGEQPHLGGWLVESRVGGVVQSATEKCFTVAACAAQHREGGQAASRCGCVVLLLCLLLRLTHTACMHATRTQVWCQGGLGKGAAVHLLLPSCSTNTAHIWIGHLTPGVKGGQHGRAAALHLLPSIAPLLPQYLRTRCVSCGCSQQMGPGGLRLSCPCLGS